MTVYIKSYTGLWSTLKASCSCFPWVFLCNVLSGPDGADVYSVLTEHQLAEYCDLDLIFKQRFLIHF